MMKSQLSCLLQRFRRTKVGKIRQLDIISELFLNLKHSQDEENMIGRRKINSTTLYFWPKSNPKQGITLQYP
jgi:hypothetical protein